MTAIIIPSTLFGAFFGYLMLTRASQWNGKALAKFKHIIAILFPALLACLLCLLLFVYPLPMTVGAIGGGLAWLLFVKIRSTRKILWGKVWHIVAAGMLAVVMISEGLLASAAAGGYPSMDPDLCVRISPARAAPALIAALKAEDFCPRYLATQSLGKIRDSSCTNALIAALGDEDYFVRMGAAQALGEIGDQRAIPALRAANARFHDIAVREALDKLNAK